MNVLRRFTRILAKATARELNYHFHRPEVLFIFLTYRCSSRCSTCTMWEREVTETELSLVELKNIAESAKRCGVTYAEMFGGDALLRKDVLIPLVAHIKEIGIPTVNLTTNCNLMDEITARELVKAGLDIVYVSVDGVGEVDDRVRGVSGSFQRVKTGLQNLIRARGCRKAPEIIVNCTISNLNVDKFEEVLFFAEDVGADAVAFECVGEFSPEIVAHSKVDGVEPSPHFMNQGKSLLLNEAQARMMKEKLKKIKARKNKIRVFTTNIDVLKIENITRGIFSHKKCYVSRCRITVDPYGNLLPCSFFNNYHYGTIRTQPLRRIWNNDKHRNFLKHVAHKDMAMCEHCIVGVERNSTFFESLKKGFFAFTKRGVDQKE